MKVQSKIEDPISLDIIEFLPEAAFVIDTNHKILAWNKELEKITGIKKEKMLGKGYSEYSLAFFDEIRPTLADLILSKEKVDVRLYDDFKRVGQSIYSETFVPKIYGGRGGYIWVKASPVYDSKKRIIGAIQSIRDITDKKLVEENLKKSEEKYREFADTLPQTVFEVDKTGKINFINSMVYKQFGYKKEEVQGKMNLSRFIDASQTSLAGKLLNERLRGLPTTNTIFRVIKKNREELLVNIYTSVIKNEKGESIGLRGFVVDVTEYQKNAEKLEKSEARYQSLFELSPDAIGVVINKKIAFVNMAMMNLLGAKRAEQIIGKNVLNFIETKTKKNVSNKIKEMLKNRSIMPLIEETLVRLDGKTVEVELTASLLKNDGENSIQIIIRDISQRKESEENLAKLYFESNIERQKMEAVMNSMGDAVFALDKDRKIILVNPIAMRLVGEDNKNIIGKKYNEIFRFILEKEKTEITDFINEVYEHGKTTSISNQAVLVKRNGNSVAVADSAAPINDEKSNVVGCVVIFRDVTKERQIDRAKSEFVSVASHQLRTPLSAIKWFLELLTNEVSGQLSDEQKDYLTQIIESNDRMIRLVNELLNASRMETGNIILNRKLIDINLIVKNVYDEIIVKILEKKQKSALEVEGELMVVTDPVLLRQVIDNLLSNANRYTQPGGLITIKTYQKETSVIFEIKDNGYGIPENQKNKLFSKFFRADNIITKQTDGTGLGLYVAKTAIETLGGKIWFESEENKGSTFYFSLPLNIQLSKS